MNIGILQGRLAQEPRMYRKDTGAGESVMCFFTLAVKYYMAKEKRESAMFIPCVAYGTQAEVVGRLLHKGDRTLVQGRMSYTNEKDEDGRWNAKFNLVVERVEFIHDSRAGKEDNPVEGEPLQMSDQSYQKNSWRKV